MKDIDKELVADLSVKISHLHKCICGLFPKENEHILKHLAASAIHMGLFMRDFYEIMNDDKIDNDKKSENEFFDECGCDFNKKE